MSTDWQPLTWHVFHTLALNYNDKYKDHYINFFETFRILIPCSTCRKHYNMNLNKISIHKNIKENNLFNWTIDLHNSVNKKTDRSQWSYDKSKIHYTKHNFDNNKLKDLVYLLIASNYKNTPLKTTKLIIFLKSIPYLIPNKNKRDKLIHFNEKFELKRINFKKWLLAFILILRS